MIVQSYSESSLIMDTHDISSILTPSAAALHLSPTLEINEAVARARASGKRIVHLGFGEAMFPIQQRILQIHRETSSRSDYLPVAGLESLRTVSSPHFIGNRSRLTRFYQDYCRVSVRPVGDKDPIRSSRRRAGV